MSNLTHKSKDLGQLSSNIAHDVNNQLAIVIGNLDLLELQLPDHAAALHRIHTAQQAATRCANLTRNLLTAAGKHNKKQNPPAKPRVPTFSLSP